MWVSSAWVFWVKVTGTLTLGPQTEVRDVWSDLEHIGYCFELVTVTSSGEVKTNIFMVRRLLTLDLWETCKSACAMHVMLIGGVYYSAMVNNNNNNNNNNNIKVKALN